MLWKLFKKKEPPVTDEVLACNSAMVEMGQQLSEVSERLRKVELGQKETSLQLEDIAEILQEDETDDSPLLDALIVFGGQIENFYRFAASNTASPLFEQAQMMWNAAKSAGEAANFEMIDDAAIPFDVNRHETASSEHLEEMPAGHVIRTLKCGYCYQGKMLRRAMVVVNRLAVKS